MNKYSVFFNTSTFEQDKWVVTNQIGGWMSTHKSQPQAERMSKKLNNAARQRQANES